MQEGGRKLKESDKFLRQRGWEERRGRETIKNAGEREIPNFWSHKSRQGQEQANRVREDILKAYKRLFFLG